MAEKEDLPVPDPTVLTTQAVDRAIGSYREVMEARLGGMDRATELVALSIAETRQGATEKITGLVGEIGRREVAQREIIVAEIRRVSDVSSERFDAVRTQFNERDTRTEQAAQESRISLDAALAAAKEAVSEQNKANALAIGKSEDATKERLDALALLMTTSVKSLEDKIGDVKSRLDRGEGRTGGQDDSRDDRRVNVGQIMLALSVLIAAVGLFVAFGH